MPVRVGLDIDGVLCAHVVGLCERIRERYDIDLRPAMVTEWDLDFGPSSIAAELKSAYRDGDFVLSLPPLEGAQTAVAALLQTDETAASAVTSRPLEAKPATDAWLKRYFPGLEVEYASSKESLPLDVLVDDFPPFVEKFAAAGGRAILFSQPWNKEAQDHMKPLSGVAVAEDWDHAMRLILGIVPQRARSAG